MSDTCPVCRHAAHGKSCPNAASDNDCGCKHDTLTLKQAPAAVPQTRRKATQRWQLKVPDHTDPKYEELNAWFYSTPNAAKGLKGGMIDYMRNLDGSHNGLSWGAAAVRKMKLRWGLALQLVNPRSVTKMIDGIISDVAGMIVAIYEEETGAPQRLLRYTPEEPPWGEMTEEQRQASTAERNASTTSTSSQGSPGTRLSNASTHSSPRTTRASPATESETRSASRRRHHEGREGRPRRAPPGLRRVRRQHGAHRAHLERHPRVRGEGLPRPAHDARVQGVPLGAGAALQRQHGRHRGLASGPAEGGRRELRRHDPGARRHELPGAGGCGEDGDPDAADGRLRPGTGGRCPPGPQRPVAGGGSHHGPVAPGPQRGVPAVRALRAAPGAHVRDRQEAREVLLPGRPMRTIETAAEALTVTTDSGEWEWMSHQTAAFDRWIELTGLYGGSDLNMLAKMLVFYPTGKGKTEIMLTCMYLVDVKRVVVVAPPVTHARWRRVGHALGIQVDTISHAKYRMKDTAFY